MIGNLLKLGLTLLVGILIYNFFFGTDEEREQSRKVFGQMKGLATSAVELAKSEKEKFDHGKYDKVMEQLGGVYRGLREKAKYLDEKVLTQLDDLEGRKAKLQKELDQLEQDEAAPAPPPAKKGAKRDPKAEEATASKAADLARRKAELQRELDKLARETEQLAKEAEKGIE